jgi:hypothetical protein
VISVISFVIVCIVNVPGHIEDGGLAVLGHADALKGDCRVGFDAREVVRAEVRVAIGLAGVDAGGLDGCVR